MRQNVPPELWLNQPAVLDAIYRVSQETGRPLSEVVQRFVDTRNEWTWDEEADRHLGNEVTILEELLRTGIEKNESPKTVIEQYAFKQELLARKVPVAWWASKDNMLRLQKARRLRAVPFAEIIDDFIAGMQEEEYDWATYDKGGNPFDPERAAKRVTKTLVRFAAHMRD